MLASGDLSGTAKEDVRAGRLTDRLAKCRPGCQSNTRHNR